MTVPTQAQYNAPTYHERKYVVIWYATPNGGVQSFRWRRDEAKARHEKLLKKGYKEINDPMRCK